MAPKSKGRITSLSHLNLKQVQKKAFLGPVLDLLQLPGPGFKCTVTAGNQLG